MKLDDLRQILESNGFVQNGDGLYRGNSPFRGDSDSKGFVVCLKEHGINKLGYFDHVTNESGKLSQLAAHYGLNDFEQKTPPSYPQTKEYYYQDEAGKLIYKVIKTPDKRFWQAHFCPQKNEWVSSMGNRKDKCDCPTIPRYPYNLSRLAEAPPGETIIITEGEKDADTAKKLGFVATCNSGGAGKWKHVPKSAYKFFKGKNVIVIADNDEAGIDHAGDVVKALERQTKSVRMIKFDGAKGYDLTDWVKDGGTKEELLNYPEDRSSENPPPDDFLLLESPDDEGNARSVLQLYPNEFIFTNEAGWHHYNGTYWDGEMADSDLQEAIIETLKQRRVLSALHDRDKLFAASKPSANNTRNCKYMLQSKVTSPYKSFDVDPDLLNCQNGVVDLRTGDITPHDKSQKFTYCLDVPYNPHADSSIWESWIYDTLKPKNDKDKEGHYAELALWIQMAIGYSLTGHTHEQCLFYLQGPPRAGKGVMLQTLKKLLKRPLAAGVDFDTFTAKRDGDSQNFDLAPLKPCRLIVASESNRTNLVNAKVVKAITGNDPVTCAFKHKTHFEYIPKYKIWLASNFKVMAQADDDALWERFRVIHFPNSYAGEEDFRLADRLWQTREGILKWAIDGAKLWYKRLEKNTGLGRPEIIKENVKAHRLENDSLGQFLEECCIEDESAYTVGSQFNSEYKRWCADTGIVPIGGRRLGEAMRRKGFVYAQKWAEGTNKKCWVGIGLLTNN